ncbi:hypothetical protein BY458DRAFT_12434 [Sporodiniella umbellata]|nr:hypothetical protein BY458DRAFT_12434 [Sporodiniella umbellata]
MAFHPTREAVHKLLGFETANRQSTQWQHYSVTLVLFVVITFLGITVRSLGKVYALIGGLAASCLAYILPALAYLLTRKQPNLFQASVHPEASSSSSFVHSPIPSLGWVDAAALLTLVWGIVILIFSTASAFK